VKINLGVIKKDKYIFDNEQAMRSELKKFFKCRDLFVDKIIKELKPELRKKGRYAIEYNTFINLVKKYIPEKLGR